jgi:hypothetical protein
MPELDLECPANYFGKGKDYCLPDDAAAVHEFERRFAEWESAHPDDPTGELALAKWEQDHANSLASKPLQRTRVETTGEKSSTVMESSDLKELELVLPAGHIAKFKNYCRLQRRRPRDIMMLWIEAYCKL